jgi:hypothetical protein
MRVKLAGSSQATEEILWRLSLKIVPNATIYMKVLSEAAEPVMFAPDAHMPRTVIRKQLAQRKEIQV